MNSRIVISNIKNNFMRVLLGVEDCSAQWTNTLLFSPKKKHFLKNMFKDILRTFQCRFKLTQY